MTAALVLSLSWPTALQAEPLRAVPVPKPRPAASATAPKAASKPATPSGVSEAPAASSPVAVSPARRPPRHPASPLAIAASASTSQGDIQALEQMLAKLRGRNISEANEIAQAISDPVARKLAEWIILRSDNNGAASERYGAFIQTNPSWPSIMLLRRRAEAALWDDRRDDGAVAAFFGRNDPVSAKGKFLLARVRLAQGDSATAARLVRDAWRNDSFGKDVEDKALEMFGGLVTASEQKTRMDALLYGEEPEIALRIGQRLGATQAAIAKARIAVANKAGNAKALLDAVPMDGHRDAGYLFSRAQWLRRNDKNAEAAQTLAQAPRDPARQINLDEWWIERRVLARKLLDDGDARSAYAVARDALPPTKGIYRTEQEFTAGWIALRFLNDPATALKHFARIGTDTENPTAHARAGYWQGRALEAMGRSQEARAAYEAGAAHSTSYYGQLARARLGVAQLGLRAAPRGTGAERLEVVRAVEILYALEENDLAVPFFNDIAERGDQPEAAAALAEAATRAGDARGLLVVGKGALNRGLPFDLHAYPVIGIPSYSTIGPEVEKSVVYAIARQESAFNPRVVSSAKAMGLMQVTPAAGKYVAKKYGASFDAKRLLSDPAYNVTLGAAELGGLIQDYRGSYIMAFAGYNAGRGRVRDWVAKYGDPRDPNVDVVDWVERIPFSETRNYVQRIMENMQVYRARFGGGNRLTIEADLKRGSVGAVATE